MTDDSKYRLIRLIIYLFVGLLFFVVMIYDSVEKPSYGAIFIVFISFIFMSIARILKGTWKYKRMLSISKFFGFIGLINVLIFLAISWIQNSNVKSNSTRLISAIEQYNIENGKYPDKLTNLTPKYIKEIPKVWIGIVQKDFIYYNNGLNTSKYNIIKPNKQNKEGSFYFAYNRFFGEIHAYNNIEKTWTRK